MVINGRTNYILPGDPMTLKKELSTHQIRSHPRNVSNSRLEVLSKPKDSKATWLTAFGPQLVWGNQQPIWPVSSAALRHIPSQRLTRLAKPKDSFTPTNLLIREFQYSCGRESSIWQVTSAAKAGCAGIRTTNLAQPKLAPEGYTQQHYSSAMSCGRVSPIWRPSKSALSCSSRPRTEQLARPKSTHSFYQPPKEVHTVISESAKQYIPSTEIENLARPKRKYDGPFRDPQWPVTSGAKLAEATQRQVELAHPKRVAEGYEPSRNIIWKVTNGARHAVASSRLCELAKPIIRETMDHVQFNPDAFQVSEAAKKAKATSRIEELAQPIQRGT